MTAVTVTNPPRSHPTSEFVSRSRLGVVILLFLFLCFIYGNYLTGVRRICHDTQLATLPYRLFLSDSLHAGVFPLWNPYSNMGTPTGAEYIYSGYNPLALPTTILTRPSTNTVVVDLMIGSVIALIGMFLWLRARGMCQALALAGSFAYAGSSLPIMLNNVYPLPVSIASIPWLFWSLNILVEADRRIDYLRGIFLLSLTGWLMVVAGYFGLVGPIYFFAAAYFAGILWIKGTITQRRKLTTLLASTTAALALMASLLFLPISEMLLIVDGNYDALRKLSNPDFSPYQGAAAASVPLSMILPNSLYLSTPLMYVSAPLALTMPAFLLTIRAKAEHWLLIALAVIATLACMGEWCPVAVFFTKFLPIFGKTRWHCIAACIPVFFSITASISMLDQWLQTNPPAYVWRRFAVICLGTFAAVAGVATLASGAPSYPMFMTGFDIASDVVLVVVLALTLCLWFWRTRFVVPDTIQTVRTGLFFALPLVLIAAAAVGYRLIPVETRLGFAQRFVTDAERVSLHHIGLPAFLDAQWFSVSVRAMFGMDIVHSGVSAIVFVGAIYCWPRRGRQWFAHTILLLVFCDIVLAAQRYPQGNTYWITSQSPPRPSTPVSVSYSENFRDPNITLFGPPDWAAIRDQRNLALLLRRPTFRSYFQVLSPSMGQFVMSDAGYAACSKLVWAIPTDLNVSVTDLPRLSIEPNALHLELTPNTMEIDVDVSVPARIIWTDAWSPGWKATVNGTTANIEKIYDCMKGVNIPAGKSHIHFWYRPTYLISGLMLFVVALFSLIWIAALSMRERSAK